jgi:hypothetical protein
MHVKIISQFPPWFEHHSLQTMPMLISTWSERLCSLPLLGHRRDAPSIPSPHSITNTPEIPPRPMMNVHADANAEHARRYGHGHAAPLCWTPQTTARSFPSQPHNLAPIYTCQKGETLVFSTLLAFVSDTVSQSVEVIVDVLDHFFSSLHG